MTDTSPLATALTGRLYLAGQPGFAEEISAFNTAIVHSPELVVAAACADDVAAAVRFAAANGLPVSVQSTGHTETAVTAGLMISTRALTEIAIDPAYGTARLGAGVRWGDVISAGAEHGLFPIAGAAATVGVGGYLLGGGFGPFVRSHGVSSDYLVSAQVVTGTGEIITASADSHPDLFWALRGGKSGLGIVIEAVVRLVPLTTFFGGSVAFAEEHIETVLRGWLDWTQTAPAAANTSVSVAAFPDLDVMPPPLRGRRLIFLRFTHPSTGPDAVAAAQPLLDLAPAYLGEYAPMPAVEVAQVHNDPADPGPSSITGLLLGPVDQDFASTFLELYGSGSDGPFVAGELRHLGSAAGTDVSTGSAVAGRGASFTAATVAVDPEPRRALVDTAMDAFHDRFRPWASPESNPNFMGAPRSATAYARAWRPDVWARLEEIRARYDPDGRFR